MQVHGILQELHAAWGITEDTEVTLETHPTHAIADRLSGWRSAGVNRVSIGVQSFQEHLLAALGAILKAE